MVKDKLFKVLNDYALLIMVLASISLIVFGIIILTKGGQCVMNPLSFYEQSTNTSLCSQCFNIVSR